MSEAKSLLIIWWSRTGAARALAQACAQAAMSEAGAGPGAEGCPVKVSLLRCDLVSETDLLAADGLVFVCPENLGSMAGMMKAFFDQHYYAALDRLNGRAYASIISAGSDGTGAARQIERVATGWRLRKVAEPVICNVAAQTPDKILAPKMLSEAQLEPARSLGQAFVTALSLGVY